MGMKKFIYASLILLFLIAQIAYGESDTKVIADMSTWQHPVRVVLEKNKVTLSKVELHNNGKFPIFFVNFPFDPQSSATSQYFKKLYLDVLQANGYWSYAFNDDSDDLIISVHWDRKIKKMTIDYEDRLKKSTHP